MVVNLLEKTYKKLIEEYDEKSILGIMVSPNKKEDKIAIAAIYLPTKEDLYSLKPIFKEKEYDSVHLSIIDIRDIINYAPEDIRDIINIIQSKNFVLNPFYQEFLLNYCKKYSNLLFSIILFGNNIKENNELVNIIQNFAIEIIKFKNEEKEQDVNCTNFLESLTSTEKNAIKVIYNIIGQEGYVSVSQLIEQYGISRPVFTSLFYKIRENQIGQVDNRGVKGTYITFNLNMENIIEKI